MSKAQNKTVETNASVEAYLKKISDTQKQNDCREIIKLVSKLTGLEPKMWGPAIIGFGSYHYKYESGREGTAPLFGFSARVNAITLYLCQHFQDREKLLAQFGKHKTGKGCVYLKTLADIDKVILMKMIANSIDYTRKTNNVK